MPVPARPAAATVRVLCLVLAVLCSLAGCSSPARTRAELVKSLDDAGSAVRTCAVSLDLLQQRRISQAVASTSLEEQSQQLASITQSLAGSEAADRASDVDRRRASALVQTGVDEVATARMLLNSGGSLVATRTALDASGEKLARLAAAIENSR
jgi:hypothetical protein